jgi:signal peptidase II
MDEAATTRVTPIRPLAVLLGVALVIYVADQATKAAIVATLAVGERVHVVGDVVQLLHARNSGAAFSILQGELWLFVIVTVAALVMVAYFHRVLRERSIWLQVILGAILGGALGNFTDRIRFGYVVDFVSVGIGDLRWPTFNVADSAVVCGIGLLVIYLTIADRRAERA